MKYLYKRVAKHYATNKYRKYLKKFNLIYIFKGHHVFLFLMNVGYIFQSLINCFIKYRRCIGKKCNTRFFRKQFTREPATTDSVLSFIKKCRFVFLVQKSIELLLKKKIPIFWKWKGGYRGNWKILLQTQTQIYCCRVWYKAFIRLFIPFELCNLSRFRKQNVEKLTIFKLY